MAKVSTNISIDADTKAKAQTLLAEFGMDLSTAVNVFLKQMIRENAIPFTINAEIPNSETRAAMKEAEDMDKYPERYKKYDSVDELMEDLLK